MFLLHDHVLFADNNLRILRVNNTHQICYSLANNQRSIFRQGFILDIGRMDSTNTKCIKLKVVFDDTLQHITIKFLYFLEFFFQTSI